MLTYETFAGSTSIVVDCSPSGECDPNYYFSCPPDIGECRPDGYCNPDANECGPDYNENCVPDCGPQE